MKSGIRQFSSPMPKYGLSGPGPPLIARIGAGDRMVVKRSPARRRWGRCGEDAECCRLKTSDGSGFWNDPTALEKLATS